MNVLIFVNLPYYFFFKYYFKYSFPLHRWRNKKRVKRKQVELKGEFNTTEDSLTWFKLTVVDVDRTLIQIHNCMHIYLYICIYTYIHPVIMKTK